MFKIKIRILFCKIQPQKIARKSILHMCKMKIQYFYYVENKSDFRCVERKETNMNFNMNQVKKLIFQRQLQVCIIIYDITDYDPKPLSECNLPKYKDHFPRRNYNYYEARVVSILPITTTTRWHKFSRSRFCFNLQSHIQHLCVRIWDQTIQNYKKIESEAQTPSNI